MGDAQVPLVPVAATLLTGFAFWSIGWGLLAWFWRRAGAPSRPGRRPLTGALMLLLTGGALIGWGWWGRGRLATAPLAVVRRPETLHVAPSTNAAAMGGMATGDVVRRERTRDGWTQLRHADGRRGWVPSPRLLPLPPANRFE